jgi:hypothetical protein
MAKSTKQNEKWVVPVYNGISYSRYLISSEGRIISKTGKLAKNSTKVKLEFGEYVEIKPASTGAGYHIHSLCQSTQKRDMIYLHRLMWESFVCQIDKGMVIDHINTEKKDNRLSNLQMITYSQNTIKGLTIDKKLKKKK